MENIKVDTIISVVCKSLILVLSLDALSPHDKIYKKLMLAITISCINTIS